MKKKYFYFTEFCFLVKGNKRAAIYDLLNQEVYSLDENLTEILKTPASASIEEKKEIAQRIGIPGEKFLDLLEELVSLGLGRYSDTQVSIDKINLDFKGALREKALVALKELTIRITGRCNLNCALCRDKSNQYCFPCKRGEPEISPSGLSIEKIKQVVDDAALFGALSIRFVGGDPLLEGDRFLEILEYAANKVEQVEVLTNLTSLENNQLAVLSGFDNVSLKVFLFSTDVEMYNKITGCGTSLTTVLKNIDRVKEQGIKISILYVKSKEQELDTVTNFMESKNFDFKFITPIPLTENDNNPGIYDDYHVKDDQFKGVSPFEFVLNKTYNQCLGQRIIVDTNGDVKACLNSPGEPLGNISMSTLRDILREGGQDKYWETTKDHIDGCRSCEFRYCCSIDCIVASENIKGTPNAQYPFCFYNPVKGEWKK